MNRTPPFVLAGPIACSTAIVVVTSGGGPARVATHVAFDGRASGWVSREGHVGARATTSSAVPLAVRISAARRVFLPKGARG